MNDSEWNGITAMITTAWPSSRWPDETQAFYRAKLEGFGADKLAAVIDRLAETQEFLPALSVILKEFQKRFPQKSGLNGAGYTYGTLEYFQNQYGEVQGRAEHEEWKKWRASQAAQLEDKRSGARGPRQIGEAL